MEIFLKGIIILITLGFIVLLLKPKKQPKSKEQKQEEILLGYKAKLHQELLGIDSVDERQKKKIVFLKTVAKELEFNLFFDKNEARVLVQELATL